MQEFVAYTDGAYDMDTLIGASAVVIMNKEESKVLYERCAARHCTPTEEKQQFSQEQEIGACIRAVMSVPDGSYLTIKTDSQYCVKVLGGEWTAHANLDLINRYKEEVRKHDIRVTFIKVLGHAAEKGGPAIWGNERADKLCTYAMERVWRRESPIYQTHNFAKDPTI